MQLRNRYSFQYLTPLVLSILNYAVARLGFAPRIFLAPRRKKFLEPRLAVSPSSETSLRRSNPSRSVRRHTPSGNKIATLFYWLGGTIYELLVGKKCSRIPVFPSSKCSNYWRWLTRTVSVYPYQTRNVPSITVTYWCI